MKEAWYLSLPRASIALAADLRLHEDIELLEDGDELWLRGRHADGPLLVSLRSLPGARLFHAAGGDRLREEHHRLWNRTAPSGEWTPLHRWAVPGAPSTAPGMGEAPRTRLRLVPDDRPAEARAVLAHFDDLSRFAETAASCRLESLEMAVSASDRVLVRGGPLPPIPGTWLAERGGVLHPVGSSWYPPLEPRLVRELVDADDGDWVLVLPEGVDRVTARQRVAASRATIRRARRGAE